MEYVAGPIIALLLGMKFTDWKSKEQAKAVLELQKRTEVVELQQTSIEKEMPKKMMATLVPMAKAVQKLNTQVGIK